MSHPRNQSNLDIVAEANDQFHWGMKIQEVEAAAHKLRTLKLCPGLLVELNAKITRMRTIDRLLKSGHTETSCLLGV